MIFISLSLIFFYLFNKFLMCGNKRRQVAGGIGRRISAETRKRTRRKSVGDGSIRGGKRGSDSEEGR